jgi:SAM-dependent methyltransferase
MVVHEVLKILPREAVILDIGSARGSFAGSAVCGSVIRIDLGRMSPSDAPNVSHVQADAARLPIRDSSIDYAVCNHSLEHMDDLHGVLAELKRVLKAGAALYVSVPDASTLTDRIYRWLARGGGHVNPFTDPRTLAHTIESETGCPHLHTWTLYSSLSFLNRHDIIGRRQHKLLLFGGGNERFLALLVRFFHAIDEALGTRLSVYGWAMYFGDTRIAPIVTQVRSHRNVCVRCGSAHPRGALEHSIVRIGWARAWTCPVCLGWNLLVCRGE